MANRKRGTFALPDELKTDEKLSTKKELAQRKIPPCPPVPNKIFRKSILASNGAFDKPKAIYFNNTVELSPNYNPNLDATYFEQIYPCHSLIGEGSFGKVYRAEGAYDKQQYAIKRLKPMISFHDRYAEIKNNEKVGVHPNCVQFYMAWEEGCEVFMLLEACQLSLSDYAARNSDIQEDLLWDVLYDMCQALKYLHGKDLLHLDVKPGNIMMKNGHYKLADFGILVDLNLAPKGIKSTLSDGDSKYLALEVLEGIYTPACDIFGLGLSLMELSADLELPSYGPLWQQLRHEILPQSFYDRVSLGFKVIIERMLKPEYEKRPSAEKILKFNTMKTIQKRDKKKPRNNYVTDFVNQDGEADLLGTDNENNNLETPRCQYHVMNYEPYGLRLSSEGPPRFNLSPKILFSDENLCGKTNSPLSAEEFFSSARESSLNSSENSMLAVTLNQTDAVPMETDGDAEAEKNLVDSELMFSGDEEEIITSTPITRSRLSRKILTFD
ncbi:membrane-associated tyrosine- and threonine-specific cdc2-inhibitory kinase [Diorhabda carinulata]|uniref:membrane-associated tyrosine- and threonine-specific cdc2-inhibitory kinase n=1 Tax=Diorhabda carinulata TaxID=1163345 RepID=UPI0025A102FB|nr:membrane-associated tyrosine- and threonine-specific cdc2-inhibitory kinase [Diorhabda carinulata]